MGALLGLAGCGSSLVSTSTSSSDSHVAYLEVLIGSPACARSLQRQRLHLEAEGC